MEVRTFAPIVIPTLNRYEHLKRCIDSLKRCSGSEKTVLVIGLDYPPSEHYQEGFEKIKEYLHTIQGFKEKIILEAESNLGVVANCNRLYDYVQKQGYDKYIFTEDDNEFAPNFLEYINWGLSTYKNDQSVYAICGCKDIDTDDIRNNVYKLNTIFNAWGFGSWLDRKEKKNKLQNREVLGDIIKKASILDAFTNKVIRLSSLTYQYAMHTFYGDMIVSLLPENEKWCIFPKVNKVRNWGWDGTGTHGGTPEAFKKYSTLPIDTDEHFEPIIVEDLYSPIVYERFKMKYKKSKKAYVRASITFLCYKLTGYIPVSNKKSKWLKVKLLKVQ